MSVIKKYDKDVTINVAVAAAVSEGLLYGIDANGKAVVADRVTGPQAAVGFAVTSLSTAQMNEGKNVALAQKGIIELETGHIAGGAFTVGATVFLDVTGEYTTTKPTTATHLVQPVGVAMTTTKVVVNIVPGVLVAQAAGNSNIGI
jgi:hypothetical protein